jgi:hypothetical protein
MKPASRPTTKRLSRTTSRNSPLAIHDNLEFTRHRVGSISRLCSLGDVCNLGDSATLATLGAKLRVK